jgi:hypothetical protein
VTHGALPDSLMRMWWCFGRAESFAPDQEELEVGVLDLVCLAACITHVQVTRTWQACGSSQVVAKLQLLSSHLPTMPMAFLQMWLTFTDNTLSTSANATVAGTSTSVRPESPTAVLDR